MRLILTHEQADFDAVASVLSAYLTSPKSYAVMPRQLNRNVHSFLQTYKNELPFIHYDDLPEETIESILLVDTQALATIKGLNRSTQYCVIDHHQLKKELPSGWKMIDTQTGACSTYLVEQIQANHIKLSIVEATLLLLGIYEDTGSLTYASTTARDAQAAAFLLDHGASLRIAADYLNPPLSDAQKKLLDELVKNIQSLSIHGQTILVSQATAENLVEEISSVAHKIVDLLNPKALFIFVNTREGIRLVSRSMTDQVNAAKITAEFGGGGHARAAAALIHPPTTKNKQAFTQELVQKFIQNLPMAILPSTTVDQIMSKQPLLIHPDTSAKDALQLMQQFGYEGYPVVKNNKVIGLLTRRAVDRALSHKLNLPAISLMEAGSVTIQSSDSLEELQYRMASSGWGQVPVVNDSTKEIIGIVTRTDLLKTLAGNNGSNHRTNLAPEMENSLSPALLGLFKLVASQAAQLDIPIYVVGGFVRDMLLKHPSPDVDFVVEGNAIVLGKTISSKYGGKLVSHAKFGTCKWQIIDIEQYLTSHIPSGTALEHARLPTSIDLISARTEFYSYPTALPTVKSGSIKLDLQRRDFTINTLAIRLDGEHYGELYDYWGGSNDLKQGLVRVLHSLSFVDDPTRMLRAVRFEKHLHFSIEGRTLHLLKEARPLLQKVSGDRIRHELDLVFSEGQPSVILERYQDLNLLSLIHPALQWKSNLKRPLDDILKHPLPKRWNMPSMIGNISIQRFLAYLIFLSNVSKENIDEVAKRLRLSALLHSALHQTFDLGKDLPKLISTEPSQTVRRLERVQTVVLFALHELNGDAKVRKLITDYLFHWKKIKPYTNGETLRKLKVPTGPIYQKILSDLKAAWIDGDIDSREKEEDLLQSLIEKYSNR